jgi:enamine deaminase RidA (YjgF/YER057c/UK114 family)
MGVFNSTIKDESLSHAFGTFPTGISEEKATELWNRYDENGDGELEKDEAKHMVIDLANLTVEWAKSNIESIMATANDGPDVDPKALIKENEDKIELAYKLMKDDAVIARILKDFDTDGDGKVSKEEFLSKATEGYDLLRPQKKAKKMAVRVHGTVTCDGQELNVIKEIKGPSVYVSIEDFFKGQDPPLCLATISPNGLVHVSGLIGMVPVKCNLVSGGVGPEMKQCLENLRLVLKACGCGMENLLKVNIYLKDNDGNSSPGGRFYEMNQAYRAFFHQDTPGTHLPARITVGCGNLAAGAQVEIDATAACA